MAHNLPLITRSENFPIAFAQGLFRISIFEFRIFRHSYWTKVQYTAPQLSDRKSETNSEKKVGL